MPRRTPSAPLLVLFDFNGVLVDDETFHFRALRETVARLGVELTRRAYDTRYMTGDDGYALRAVLGDAGKRPGKRAVSALVRRKRAAYRRLVGGAPTIDPRIARLVRALARRATLGIVSSGARREIEASLCAAGVRPFFATIVAAGEVPRAKPHSDPYLRALHRLRIRDGGRAAPAAAQARREGRSAPRAKPAAGLARSSSILVIEDSAGGIRAARGAGIVSILGVATTRPASALRRAGALQVVPTLAGLRVADLLALLPVENRARRLS